MKRADLLRLVRGYAAEDGPKAQARVIRLRVEHRISHEAWAAECRAGWAIYRRMQEGATFWDASRPA